MTERPDPAMARLHEALREIYGPPPEAPPTLHPISAGDLLDAEIAPVVSLLGDGILPRATFSTLVGDPGAGKSRVALQLGAAIATGSPWFDISTSTGRVCMVSMELPARKCQERLQILVPSLEAQITTLRENLFFVTSEQLTSNLKIVDHEATLSEIAGNHDLIVIDTFARAFGGDENSKEEVGEVTDTLDRICRTTGAHIMLVHHSPIATKDRSPAYPGRGSSVLYTNAITNLVLLPNKISKSMMRLRCLKANFGVPFDDLWIDYRPGEPYRVVEDPSAGKQRRLEIEISLLDGATSDLSAEEIHTALILQDITVKPRTVQDDLRELVAAAQVQMTGKGRLTRYRIVHADDSVHDSVHDTRNDILDLPL